MTIPPDSPPSLDILDESSIDAALDANIRQGLYRSFPDAAAAFAEGRGWHGSRPAYSVVLRLGAEVIAHVGIVDRQIRAGATPLRVAGVMNVFVIPSCRGGRLAARVVHAAMEEATRRLMDFGLLFSIGQLVPLYTRMGWQDLPGRGVIRIEGGAELPLPEGNLPMLYPLRRAEFPPGPIHLQGNDW